MTHTPAPAIDAATIRPDLPRHVVDTLLAVREINSRTLAPAPASAPAYTGPERRTTHPTT